MSCSIGVVKTGDLASRFETGNCNEMSVLSLAATVITFKDKSAKDFRARVMMTSVFASVH